MGPAGELGTADEAGGRLLKKPTDIERLFQHVGLTDMRYHEFVADQDPVRARENWSLVDSSVEAGEERAPGHVPLARPAPPVKRSGAFYDRVAELRRLKRSGAETSAEHRAHTPAPSEPSQVSSESGERSTGSLRDVFSRVRGQRSETESPSSEGAGGTPLSDVFKRLS